MLRPALQIRNPTPTMVLFVFVLCCRADQLPDHLPVLIMSAALKFRSIYSASIESAESQCNFSNNAPQPQSKSWEVVEAVPEATADSDGTKADSFDDQKEHKPSDVIKVSELN